MSKNGWKFLLLSCLALAVGRVSAAEKTIDRAAILGQKIDDFSLADFRGKKHALADYADKKLLVVAFLGNECPLAKVYAPRLEELQKEFADRGVAFVGINSNRQDTPTEMAAFVKQTAVTFPLLKDAGNAVADRFTAERTPEVFLLDGERRVRYRGRIDDQYGLSTSAGYARPRLRTRDLAEAIEQLLDGKEVAHGLTEATGCLIGRVKRVEPRGEVTYSNQIARLLDRHCVDCHRSGEVAPFALLDYNEVVGWADMMLEVIDEGRMPPWFANPEFGHFSNDARLSEEEKKIFRTWVSNGCPEGDKQDLPPPREFVAGWQMGEPDQIVYMRDKPFNVPAEGVVSYQYFVVDPGFTEDKWIQAVEARPGNRAVVHHILVFVKTPKQRGDFRGGDGLVGYAPGDKPRVYPLGVAAHVPAGSRFIFQMHYTPNGTAGEDRSYIGLKFADPQTVKKTARGGAALTRMFSIPPGADNYLVVSQHLFRRDAMLLSLFPHMHLRGKAFRFEAKYPDGTSEVLLDVPRFDFNWQLRYELAEPKLVPRGTRLLCTARFDNSEGNPANPDPKATVRWGDQTWEEMMIGFFSAVAVHEDGPATKQPEPKPDAVDKQAAARSQPEQ